MGWPLSSHQPHVPADHTGRYHKSSSVFPYSWEQIVIAFWLRYPNPFSSHVLSEDVLDRFVTSDKKLVTKRLLTKTNRLPKWAEKIVPGPRQVLMVEESVVDPANQELTTYTYNLGYTKIMSVDEKCWYHPLKSDPDSTELSREAYMESHVYGFAKAIQAFAVKRYKRNTDKTTKGFDYVLDHLYPSGEPVDKIPNASRIASLAARMESLRNSAKKAKELAKQKTSDFLHSKST